ncbi:disease resistance protein RPV1 isoform X2 [Cryptomeria japonica]|uniref:disease resistance protein RPV1 isoform X2 n=1 Tax=Cryptomeria japonica TaxID=3369 RepID=UPI0027D9E303|nr:disease resistance protein RPV1 isoform X2 [Cryptomeria japonica]
MEQVFPRYHVFINHRGPDVKKTLGSLIYRALKRIGLRVFLDEQELQTGNYLTPAIKTAISNATVHVAIFSETYAESPWCLNELLWMLDCHGGKLIPIFYGIQPSDLRYIQKGAYAEAFNNHKSKGRVKYSLVERWMSALIKVSDVSGLVFSKVKDDLGEFLDRIVDTVLKEVTVEALDVAIHPVGLHQAAEHFQNKVLNQTTMNDIIIVGIVGLGGSGKSTLVTHLYNTKRSQFSRCCYLSDVSKKNLASLQKRLLTDLLGFQPYLHIENTSRGRSLLRDRLRGFKVLIVLDEVDNIEQIENLLLVVKDVLGNGSLILVTSRDRDLLARSQIKVLYDVQLLDLKDAHELFCWHAFHEPKSPPDLQDMVEELAKMCGGFPLALKVLGGQLSSYGDRSYWMRQLENFRQQLPDNILDRVLKVTYDSLKNKEKEAFLDIAHLLVGEDRDLAVRVLDGLDQSGFDCLEVLHHKGLVQFENSDVDFNINIQHRMYLLPFLERTDPKSMLEYLFMQNYIREPFYIDCWSRPKGSLRIRMNDLVRDLAIQIGRQEFPLRLCCSNDQMISAQMQSKPYSVRGIRGNEDHKKLQLPVFLDSQDICGLKLVALEDSGILHQFNSVTGDLIWLRLGKFNCSDFNCRGLSLRNLRVLELTGVNFEGLHRLSDDFEDPSQLRELTVSCTEISDTVIFRRSAPLAVTSYHPSSSGFNKVLLHSDLSEKRVRNLKLQIKPSKQLARLDSFKEHVEKRNVKNKSSSDPGLNSFQEWLGKLKNLAKLALKNIKGLVSLPIKFEEAGTLRHVDLSGCNDLEVLPHSFTELLQLQYLALRDCWSLVITDLGKISTLEYLDLQGCFSLKDLPRGTTVQKSLRYLNLLHTSLQQLPEHIDQLENLEQLYIGSQLVTCLPSSLNHLSRLTELTLFKCFNLYDVSKSVELLGHLEILRIYDSGVRALPEEIAWMNIKILDIRCCPNIEGFQMEVDLPFESLQVQSQTSDDHGANAVDPLATKATHSNRVSCLTSLIIRYSCISKVCIPRAKNLCPNLEIVDLSNNPNLTDIEGLPANLIRLNLMDCPALETLRCLSNLTSLKFLNVSGCGGLQTLNVEGLSSIELIEADECWKLQRIQGLRQLQKLSHLRISTGFSISGSTWTDILDADAHSFQNVTVMDIPQFPLDSGIPFFVELENESLQGAILICIIADNSCSFEVTFLGHAFRTSRIFCHGNTYGVHMLMWTKDSRVFKDLKICSGMTIDCKIKLLNSSQQEDLSLRKTSAGLKRGWVVIAKNLDFCKQFLSFLFC